MLDEAGPLQVLENRPLSLGGDCVHRNGRSGNDWADRTYFLGKARIRP